MKHYSSRIETRRFWIRRVLIIVLAVCLIVVATITVGQMLKSRSDLLEARESQTKDATEAPRTDKTPTFNNSSGADALSLRGAFIDLSLCTSSAEAVRLVRLAAAGGANAVSFVLTDASGALLYRSAAAAAIARSTAGLAELETLRAAIAQAASDSLRCSAIFVPGGFLTGSTFREESLAFDAAVIGEIAGLGFDEVILNGLPETETLDATEAQTLISYLSALRSAAPGLDLGLSFRPAIYLDTMSVIQLERLCLYADFLAADLTSALPAASVAGPDGTTISPEEALTSVCTSIADSLSAYNLRALAAPRNTEESTTVARVFSACGITNYQAVSPAA